MADQDIPHPVAARIVAHLEAAISGEDPAANVVHALRILLQDLAEFVRTATVADGNLLMDRLILVLPIVSRAVERQLPAEQVHLGIGATAGLVRQLIIPMDRCETAVLIAARVQHIALIADELDAIVRRREIEAAGDPLRRAIRIAAASAIHSASGPLH